MDLGLAGRVGVVAGAHGEVGTATARLLRAEGAEVVELPAEGDDAERILGGLTAPGDAECILGTPAQPGAVDFLVTIADAVPDDDLRAAHELGVMAPLRAMKAVAPVLAARGSGRIVNVCPPARTVAGAAARSLSRLFADHYAKRGVLVNALCPDPDADPEASAREIAFLCSARASHVAGATWTVGATAGAID
jgi:NAD(P)-dependent dehydrogenase (short-subunit alcohol dehydrogenase family)